MKFVYKGPDDNKSALVRLGVEHVMLAQYQTASEIILKESISTMV